jgi:hypothetical protein
MFDVDLSCCSSLRSDVSGIGTIESLRSRLDVATKGPNSSLMRLSERLRLGEVIDAL